MHHVPEGSGTDGETAAADEIADLPGKGKKEFPTETIPDSIRPCVVSWIWDWLLFCFWGAVCYCSTMDIRAGHVELLPTRVSPPRATGDSEQSAG